MAYVVTKINKVLHPCINNSELSLAYYKEAKPEKNYQNPKDAYNFFVRDPNVDLAILRSVIHDLYVTQLQDLRDYELEQTSRSK
jgi:hypothetical protein